MVARALLLFLILLTFCAPASSQAQDPYSRESLARMGGAAGRGALHDDDRKTLQSIDPAHDNYTMAWALLMADSEARRDNEGHCEATGRILAVKQNGEHPEYNLEAAKCSMRKGDLKAAIKHAEVTIANWSSLNPRTSTSRGLLAHEIRARCLSKIADDSSKASGTHDPLEVTAALVAWADFEAFASDRGDVAAVQKAQLQSEDLRALLEPKESPRAEPPAASRGGLSGFRGVLWGSSRAAVVKSEGTAPAKETEHAVAFVETVAGLNCLAIYYLRADSLYGAGYVVTQAHSNTNEYVTDFDTLYNLLVEKYGNSDSMDQIWKSDVYRGRDDQLGMAVVSGHLEYLAKWEFKEGSVVLNLTGDNFEPSLSLMYSSREHSGEAAEERLEKELDKL